MNNKLLTRSEVIFMVFGSILAIGILSLPNEAAKIAYEDAWIAVAAGGLYPIYLILIEAYLIKKFPNDNVLALSKRFLGKYLGTAFNIIFFANFFVLCAELVSGYNNVIRTFIEGFLDSYKIEIVFIMLVAFTSSKGLKILGKVSVIVFYISFIIFITPLPALQAGSIDNVLPIGKSGINNILLGSKTTAFAYAGIETIFIIHPYVKEKNKFIKDAFIGIFITIFIYVWATFISIYYLGADIAVKNYWPFLTVTESVTISIVNNYRYIFMFLWTLSVFKITSNDYYIAVHILNSSMKKFSIKTLSFAVAPILLLVSLKFSNVIERGNITPKTSLFFLVFNTVGLTTLVVIIFLKEGLKSEK